MVAASAMKPRPAVIWSVNWCWSSARYAPPRPASAPESATASQRMRFTRMPTDSAADGCSPTARMRSPNGVRYNAHPTTSSARTPSQTSGLRTSAPNPVPVSMNPDRRGELEELSKVSRKKNRVMPIASRLIAMPTTTWFARYRMQHRPYSNPATAPPPIPASTPSQGLPPK